MFVLLVFQCPASFSQTASIDTLELDGFSSKLPVQQPKTGSDSLSNISFRDYFRLLPYNFKQQAFFPLHLSKKGWLQLGAYGAATAGIALANKPVKIYAKSLHDNNTTVATASKYITRFGNSYGIYTMAGLFTYSGIFKNNKLRNTTLLASQAYVISNVLGGAVKVLTSVQGPFYTDPLTKKRGPIFHGPFYTLKKGPDGQKLKSTNYVSFPSGHTYTAFAIATVYAMEYKDKPLIPILCYTTASLVGLSRLTENRHWAMDILPGALLGYFSARQVVKSYHRYSAKAPNGVSSNISLQVNYVNSQVVPGLVYSF